MKRWLRWLILLAGYPFVMWLVWIWLGVSERDPGDLILSFLLALGIVAGLTGLVWIVFGGSVWRALGFVLSIMTLTILMSLLPSWSVPLNHWAAQYRWIYPWLLRAVTLALMATTLPIVLMGSSVLLRTWQYWCAWAVLTLGVYVIPAWLVRWVPELSSMAAQTASMVVRFGLAYLIALATLTAFARFVRQLAEGQSSAIPGAQQPHTAAPAP
ncbi:MAG: hypothetical protein SGI92_03695 [Bryobacteraceae bacterium]|nr:hypothetical protein [Bryobacteraceae bacterium]